MDQDKKPSVLFVYYSFTRQTHRVVEAMAGALRDRNVEVTVAQIEFTDRRYAHRFDKFPMPHPYLDVFKMIPATLRRATGSIRIPDGTTEREYDLVCIGSPTWWMSMSVPVRSFLESDAAARVLAGKPFAIAVLCRRYWRHNFNSVKRLATKRGGLFKGGIHFVYQSGQVRSMLSLLSYFGSGEYRSRYLGVKIRPTNLREFQLEDARAFANELASQLFVTAS
jgi:menaquinone-dependent protoporphyrinogen IX oxidase